jgi:hypothetical protein
LIANAPLLSQEELDRRRLEASSRVQNLTSIYDELFALAHELTRERTRPEVTNDPERLAFIEASRKRARKALYWLNVYAQNGLRNSIDTHVLLEVARHAHAYDTRGVTNVTRQQTDRLTCGNESR